MTRSAKKFVAVLMLLWLPLFSGNTLAATVSMQMQQGDCHESAASQEMQHQNMGGHHEMSATADDQSPACNACDICHLACAGYLAVPSTEMVTVQTSAREATPYLLVFHSFTSAPLVPPPLARA